MAQLFSNTEQKYQNERGKWVFVPSRNGRAIGRKLIKRVRSKFDIPPFCFHLAKGGHVAALHIHRNQKYFARLDLENFFYSVSRNRIARSLQALEFTDAETMAKWSTVKNPYDGPSYVLPYGFVQSPILATLVMNDTELGRHLRDASNRLVVSVYVDDIGISGNNRQQLEAEYQKLRDYVLNSDFRINEQKSSGPQEVIELFNCELSNLKTIVTPRRIEEFRFTARSELSEESFFRYCASVVEGNGEA